jgi:hypothetical protein
LTIEISYPQAIMHPKWSDRACANCQFLIYDDGDASVGMDGHGPVCEKDEEGALDCLDRDYANFCPFFKPRDPEKWDGRCDYFWPGPPCEPEDEIAPEILNQILEEHYSGLSSSDYFTY